MRAFIFILIFIPTVCFQQAASADVHQVNGYWKGATYVRVQPLPEQRVSIESCDLGYEDAGSCQAIGHRRDYTQQELLVKYRALKRSSKRRWKALVLFAALNCAAAGELLPPAIETGSYKLLAAVGMWDATALFLNPKSSTYFGSEETKEIDFQVKDYSDPLTVSWVADTVSPNFVACRPLVTPDINRYILRLKSVLLSLN